MTQGAGSVGEPARPGGVRGLLSIIPRDRASAMRLIRQPLVAAVVGCVVLVIVAMWVPVRAPGGTFEDGAGLSFDGSPSLAGAEDLSAFVASRRWGGASLREIVDSIAASTAAAAAAEASAGEPPPPTEPPVEPVGFVGIAATAQDHVALLKLSNGDVLRVPKGDRLADGRTLSSLTDNLLTLDASDESRAPEVMALFPEVPTTTSDE